MYYCSGAVLLHWTWMHCSELHNTAGFSYTLRPTALTCTAFFAPYCTAPTCDEMQGSVIHCTLLHWTALNFNQLHCAALQCPAVHCIALHCIALQWTALQKSAKVCRKRENMFQKVGFHWIGVTICTHGERVSVFSIRDFLKLMSNYFL